MIRKLFMGSASLLLAMGVMACSEDTADGDCSGTGPTRCLGGFPTDSVSVDPSGDITVLEWEAGDTGPICAYGGEFRSFIRAGASSSTDLVIYLPNDGVWLPRYPTVLLSQGRAPTNFSNAPQTSYTSSDHPVIGSADLLYVSACDGSLYVGSRDYTEEEVEGSEYPTDDARFYRGFINLVASLNALPTHIDDPERIFLIGSGAGSYGVLLASFHVAALYPDAELVIIQDGSPGFGFGRFDTSFVDSLVEAWGVERTLPPCSYCLENGHLTGYVRYILESIPNARVASYVSNRESSIPLFLNITSPADRITDARFECFIQQEFTELKEAFPDRFQYYVTDSTANTVDGLRSADSPDDTSQSGYNYVATDFESGDELRFIDWLEAFSDDTASQRSISEISMVAGTDPAACR